MDDARNNLLVIFTLKCLQITCRTGGRTSAQQFKIDLRLLIVIFVSTCQSAIIITSIVLAEERGESTAMSFNDESHTWFY